MLRQKSRSLRTRFGAWSTTSCHRRSKWFGPKQGSVGWGTGPKKFSEQFAYLMPFKHHVTLGFYYGGELRDPAGLLPSAGGRQVSGRLAMRSMKLTTLEQVRQPALRALLDDAVRHRVPAPSSKE